MTAFYKMFWLSLFILPFFLACNQESGHQEFELASIDLKRGEIALCNDPNLGNVSFTFSCDYEVKEVFNMAVALLHSFEYTEAEKIFVKVIDADPDCAMAYWGVAMSNFHPLWAPPKQKDLEKGSAVLAIAKEIEDKTERETRYIDALTLYYTDYKNLDHKTRANKFEKAMEDIYNNFPDDREAAIFYALALNATADPTDKTYSHQKKAVGILEKQFPDNPDHPGIAHYIIHNYDYPELAQLALPAARSYAGIAPASAHAQHMPSHIFIRLGLWDEAIVSNINSSEAAVCYVENAGLEGHWSQELHALDYMVYAYLQKGQNSKAMEILDYVKNIDQVTPHDFAVSYAMAAIPSRWALENQLWEEASTLTQTTELFPWEKFPWMRALTHFTRVLGSVHTGDLVSANSELATLELLHQELIDLEDSYKANQVMIQIIASKAWIAFGEGKPEEAVDLMIIAADMEDSTEKHPVTPGEVLPARELLADLYMKLEMYEKAFEAYELDLKRHPKRLNGVYGAAKAAQKIGDNDKVEFYFTHLLEFTDTENIERAEIKEALEFVNDNGITAMK